MSSPVDRAITFAAYACFVIGVALSHLVEPGVEVTNVMIGGKTPAIHFLPATPGPHPIALLAHGVTASKETLFRFGEALAAAGFECYAIDFPGHGASSSAFAPRKMSGGLSADASAVGPVDIFLGHSMGSYIGGLAVREGGFNPKLFIAVGASPQLGSAGPPLLLLAGEWEQAVSLKRLKARTDGRVILFPWCDHALEPFDPPLVNAAVEAACAVVGRAHPTVTPTMWIWRLFGLVLGLTGIVVALMRLPALPPQWAWLRGPLFVGVMIAALALTCGTWFGIAPHWRRLPCQIVVATGAWLVIWGLDKLGVPRWTLTIGTVVLALACTIFGAPFLGLVGGIVALILFAGRLIGRMAARNGLLRDEQIAAAIFVGYMLGQLIPTPI